MSSISSEFEGDNKESDDEDATAKSSKTLNIHSRLSSNRRNVRKTNDNSTSVKTKNKHDKNYAQQNDEFNSLSNRLIDGTESESSDSNNENNEHTKTIDNARTRRFPIESTNTEKSYRKSPEKISINPILCRYGARCSNMDCKFTHSRLSGNILRAEVPCKHGRNCRRIGCYFGHPDGRLIDENDFSSSDSDQQDNEDKNSTDSASENGSHVPAEDSGYRFEKSQKRIGINPTPCRYGASCRTRLCTFTHTTKTVGERRGRPRCKYNKNCMRIGCYFEHPNGRWIDSNRVQSAAPIRQDHRNLESISRSFLHNANDRSKDSQFRCAETPREIAINIKLCRFGANCRRDNCTYAHLTPTKVIQQDNVNCKNDRKCTREGCYFGHPNGRLIDENESDSSASIQSEDDNVNDTTEDVQREEMKSRTKIVKSTKLCLFGDICQTDNCSFKHPKSDDDGQY